jgi:hypothetical protein
MRGWWGVAGVAVLVLAGCASPQSRIAKTLVSYGVPPKPAECVADQMVDQLSRDQLRTVTQVIQVANRRGEIDPDRVTLGQAMDLVARAGDPAITAVAVRAGTACLILNAR